MKHDSTKHVDNNFSSKTHFKRPSEGLPGTMSETTIDVSPLLKWGLSLPPDTAIPNPWFAFAYKKHNQVITGLQAFKGTHYFAVKKKGYKVVIWNVQKLINFRLYNVKSEKQGSPILNTQTQSQKGFPYDQLNLQICFGFCKFLSKTNKRGKIRMARLS